jgi:putative peptidoglycan lipid II flippase
MFKRLLSVGGFTLLSRITGFIRDILMASVLGKGALSDAFLVAFRFPNYFRAIFGEGTINPAFLPRYAAFRAKGEHEAAARFGDQVFAWQIAIQAVLLIGALAAMPYLVRVIAPGFSDHPGQLALATTLSRITFPYLILTVVVVQLSAMLNANEKFWAAAAWSNFLNLAMIGTILAAAWFPNAAYAATCGVLIGGVIELVFMLWASARHGLRLRFRWPRWTPEIKEFFLAVGAVTFGTASVTVSPFVDTIIASFLPAGSLTALYYADRINQLPLGVLGIALGTVLLPEMSTRLARGDVTGSDAAQNRAAAFGLLLTLPFLAVFLAVPATIMSAIFAHGAFDRSAAELSAVALSAYGVGLPAMVLVRIVSSTFYARHDTATPAKATVTSIVANVAIKMILVWGFHLGIAGIALGTAIGAWVNVGALTWFSHRRGFLNVQPVFRRALLPIFLAALAAGLGATAGVDLVKQFHMSSRLDFWIFHVPAATLQVEMALGMAALLGCAGYGAVALAFRRLLPLERFARK